MATDEENIAFARAAICGATNDYPATYHDKLVELCLHLRQALAVANKAIPEPPTGTEGPYWEIEKPSDDVAQQVSSRFPLLTTHLNVRELIDYAATLTDAIYPRPKPVETPVPTGLTAVVNSDRTVDLNWNDVASATYNIYETVMSPNTVVDTVTPSESKRGPLAPGSYNYYVTALIEGKESAPSKQVALTVLSPTTPDPEPEPQPTERPDWAANFSSGRNSTEFGFGRVQREYGGGSISTTSTPIAGGNVPELGNCIVHQMDRNQKRLEAAPGSGGSGYTEGAERFFRFEFSLGDNFPIGQSDSFCCVNQIHQGSGSGSPPIEFDIKNSGLYVRGSYNQNGGNRTTYDRKLIDVVRRRKYSVIYRVKFSEQASKCLLEVWVDGTKRLSNFVPPSPNMWGGSSYWKGSTMYCRETIPPLTCYQAGHRVGRSYASVAG